MTIQETKEILVRIGKLRFVYMYKLDDYDVNVISSIVRRMDNCQIVLRSQYSYLLRLEKKIIRYNKLKETLCSKKEQQLNIVKIALVNLIHTIQPQAPVVESVKTPCIDGMLQEENINKNQSQSTNG